MNRPNPISATARSGDKVRTQGASDVPDGIWEVVEALPRAEGAKSNGGYRCRLRVKALRRQTPEWPMGIWWVEDISVMEVFKGPRLVSCMEGETK